MRIINGLVIIDEDIVSISPSNSYGICTIREQNGTTIEIPLKVVERIIAVDETHKKHFGNK